MPVFVRKILIFITGYAWLVLLAGPGLIALSVYSSWKADGDHAYAAKESLQSVSGKVTQASDPDLFWALRGGGGDFGIVTAVELELFPAPELYGGRLVWSIEHGKTRSTCMAGPSSGLNSGTETGSAVAPEGLSSFRGK